MNFLDGFSIPALAGVLFTAAFALGVAIQHGTTCAVRAMSELIRERRADGLLGFLECGLWALLVAWLLTPDTAVPQWEPVGWLCLGAALFGAGATMNCGCAFGSIARLGEGRAEFLLTGAGAYLSFRILDALGEGRSTLPEQSPVPENALLIVLVGLPLLIGVRFLVWRRPIGIVLQLSMLMAVIGIIGAFVGALHQPWPWMLALRFIGTSNWLTVLGLVGLVSGSIANGVVRGRFRLARPKLAAVRDRFAGGMLMGAGSALVPGGNDSLILQGIPSGSPSAFLAYGIVLATIGALLLTVPRFNLH
ncbi:putative membrane protein YedE/YeeE [Phyllobacterium ifriqiyense]|uniref:Membrane protein YedE/YeeE n=1 Tax=Phyllobacterium ifriqiyense TaxID=314238 RepID=A0ABU0S871_9HYPH|nr:YeeE/YedE thiosulfate transporter family protein [Phyllobacterium ifriqiyense]MDQ0996145.1 putative membrane protein YedE/YeeE [Phyllobacterium ifriqiyense]